MHWYERVAAAFDAQTPKVSRAEVGRRLGLTGQAITLKLQGKRPVTVEELQVFAEFARMTVAEALGDDAMWLELKDEMDLVTLFRLLTPEQQAMILGLVRQMAPPPAQPAK